MNTKLATFPSLSIDCANKKHVSQQQINQYLDPAISMLTSSIEYCQMGGGSERNQGMFQPVLSPSDLDLDSPASKTIHDAGLTDFEKPT